MSGKKKDNDYRWLQEQLTRDVHMLAETKIKGKERVAEEWLEDEEEECSKKEADDTAYAREMKEIQQALATEVVEHTTKRSKKDTSHSSESMSNDRIVNNYEDLKSGNQSERLPIWMGLLIAVVFVIVSVGIVICGKNIGKTVLTSMGLLEDHSNVTMEEARFVPTQELLITEVPTTTLEITQMAEEPEQEDDEVYNLLLLGIENLENEKNADAIVVVSMNVTDKTYHLIQFMRDLYLKIPGYGSDRLSTAYKNGGGILVTQTISENFDLAIEGYLSVNLESFVKMIDYMGGITIKLTKEEAEYLNTTNYISKKSNRTMIKGKQLVNGDQALGYCRIQYVPNSENLSYDFGRVARIKAVFNQIFQKVSNMTLGELLHTMNEFLPYIRTNLTKDKFKTILEIISEQGVQSFDSLRVPIYTLYERDTINKQTVYIPVIEESRQKIHILINGEEEVE